MSTPDIPSDSEQPSVIYSAGPWPRLDLMNDLYSWQQQVQRALQALKYIGRQESATSEPRKVTFQEAMRELYGKSHFSAFIASRTWQHASLDGQTAQEFQKLQQLLNSFEEPDSDELLATDSDWQVILAQVEIVAALL
ncbi:hypothetical protein [Hymenobacter negativus]|uniref:Uncharacterized protein n=1 Tax=Hymenobacter negativus TaxID=2795026 RepID=A0ABS3Q8P4_9BACT|nr:hypothetical protein [Hymenobacter negativus]MBO2007624.1 hypothetical protein [Hymenobacter negativus]